MLLLGALIVASIVALSAAFGFRGGAYRGPGLIVGCALIVAVLVLIMGNHVH